uniref:C2H2-type domain-containing protein n=1 Tax=Panagrolaimus sp. PS1159 TaxID=55785 RepID=A0AC35FTZ8_9BILA
MSQKFDFLKLRKRNYSGTTITNTSTQSQSILSSPITSSDAKKAKYQCGKCDKILSTLSGFRNHLRRTHDGEKPFKCDRCDLSYKHASGLCLHRRSIHGDTNELECTKCLKAFNCRGNLKRHLLTHVNSVEREEIWKQNYV